MKSHILIEPSKEAVSNWNGFSGFRMAAVTSSECPSPEESREADPLDVVDDSVDTTFPDATEYILTEEPTIEKK
jgi:hypothetical protein